MSITTITGYSSFATARVGSNGESGSPAELFVGTSASDKSSGRKTWTTSTSSGFDSDWVSVVWTVLAGGGNGSLEWQVAGASPSPVGHAGSQVTQIGLVKLRAGVVGGNRRASFRNVVIAFYTSASDTQAAEEISLGQGSTPVASTWGQTGSVSAEYPVTIQPDGGGYQKLKVTADVRLECGDPGLPSEETIVTDLYAFVS